MKREMEQVFKKNNFFTDIIISTLNKVSTEEEVGCE